MIGRGKTGIGQYVFALTRALLAQGGAHRFVLFVLEEDLPLFDFAKDRVELVPVPEKFRPAVNDIRWHQTQLPRLAGELRLDVLHVPSYRRMLWRKPCPLVVTIHDLAPFRVAGKYDWMRMFYALRSLRSLKHASLDEKAEYWQAGKSVEGIEKIEPAGEIVARFATAARNG